MGLRHEFPVQHTLQQQESTRLMGLTSQAGGVGNPYCIHKALVGTARRLLGGVAVEGGDVGKVNQRRHAVVAGPCKPHAMQQM